ncbi:helix-turn-helix domain-containing protein [Oscillospiraceae bacterium OttesenSCG-928-G22]|nr:helix-turn-helix domain-containing protein [Oscillospiraceae bacterium OttesenSCG-928-G22]
MLIKRDIYALGLPHRAVAVYMYLCDRANDVGSCFPSHRTIAGDLGLSISTVKRALCDLEQAECICKSARHLPRRGRTSNLYQV